jgi:3-deoxy-manno-octulosonate cytidylyltransferase (CMP-KDO synthetase)
MKKIICCIPARYQSSRLPGKPLLEIDNETVITRVYKQVKKCKRIDEIVVLTDDIRIKEEVEKNGGNAVMILEDCLNGTERIISYLKLSKNDVDIVVNVQGDEPFINPVDIDYCIENYFYRKYNIKFNVLETEFKNDEQLVSSTMCHILENEKSILENRSKGKVILDKNNQINKDATYYGHIGVFVFDKDYLINEFSKENTTYQIYEDIEWMKIIEQGYKINTVIVEEQERGIDTQEDYEYFLNKYNKT